jgi:hypothetical protein
VDEPASITAAYSPYERATIRDAEAFLGTTVDPVPEGKFIERIDTVRLDPIEDRDPVPTFLDAIHTTTKDDVIRHEVLLRVGDPYRRIVADESARNIRRFARVSIVIVTAMRGSADDRVRVVVITKDVWSILPDFDFSATSGGVESMLVEVEETNLAGRQQSLIGSMYLQPKSVAVGLAYVAPRFTGRWLSLVARSSIIWNRDDGHIEGSSGEARIERPLYSTRTDWAWLTGVAWTDEVARRYTNAQVATFVGTTGSVPWTFRARKIEQTVSTTRSFGWARKNDITFGGYASHDLYRAQVPLPEFERAVVPVGESRVSPFAEWRSYTNDFLRIVDYESLALQEDVRLGYDVIVRAYPVFRGLGSSRDLAGARAAVAYTARLGDGFVRGFVDTLHEHDFGANRISDASITGDVRVVTPRTPAGRLVFDTTVTNRWRNYLNRQLVLGGEDRLRGYPTRFFQGKDLVAMNLEFRTRPVELASCHFGGALFYDAGAAFAGFDRLDPAQSVGVGLRAVFPQIDRAVLRFDVGFPIGDDRVDPVSFFVTFGQAFKAAGIPPPLGP